MWQVDRGVSARIRVRGVERGTRPLFDSTQDSIGTNVEALAFSEPAGTLTLDTDTGTPLSWFSFSLKAAALALFLSSSRLVFALNDTFCAGVGMPG